MSVPWLASYFDPPLLLSCLLVVTGGAEVLQVGAVHEAATVGEWGDVVDVGARDGQPVGGAVGTERVVAPDARAADDSDDASVSASSGPYVVHVVHLHVNP